MLKKYWNYIFSFLVILLLIPLLSESIERVLIILLIVIIWNVLGIIFKDFVKSSLLLLLLILPFNITYQLPYYLLGFEIADPFVDGIIVNYLIPTVSIIDLAVLLLLLSLLFKKKVDFEWRGFSFLKIFSLFGVYLLLQSLFKGTFLSFFNSFRLLLYIFSFYNLKREIKDLFHQKDYILLLLLSTLLVLFQGVIAFFQFRGGASLGLTFLGESQVVSGMMGSSFLTLNNQLFLRGYGTFPHPNLFGGWLIFNILLGWFLFESMSRQRGYSIILMGLSSLVLVLSFSRISFLLCAILWIAFLIKVFVRSKELKNFAFLGLVSERVMNLFVGGDSSWEDRVGLMKASFKMIKKNLFTGVGLGKFVESMGESVPRSSKGILLLQPVHNIFMLIISEIGLIGFSLYTTLLYFFFKNREFSLRVIVGVVVLLIIGMFDHYLFSLPQGLGVFFLILSL